MNEFLLISKNKMNMEQLINFNSKDNKIRVGHNIYINLSNSKKIDPKNLIDFLKREGIEFFIDKIENTFNFTIKYWYGEQIIIDFSIPYFNNCIIDNEEIFFEQSYTEFLKLIKALKYKF